MTDSCLTAAAAAEAKACLQPNVALAHYCLAMCCCCCCWILIKTFARIVRQQQESAVKRKTNKKFGLKPGNKQLMKLSRNRLWPTARSPYKWHLSLRRTCLCLSWRLQLTFVCMCGLVGLSQFPMPHCSCTRCEKGEDVTRSSLIRLLRARVAVNAQIYGQLFLRMSAIKTSSFRSAMRGRCSRY